MQEPPADLFRRADAGSASLPVRRTLRPAGQLSQRPVSFKLLGNVGALRAYSRDLARLSKSAIVSNVFYEPWMLFPALDAFARNRRFTFVLAYANSEIDRAGEAELCGFFPLEHRNSYRGMPVTSLALWRHPYSFLATPLLKNGYASSVLASFLTWFQAQGSAAQLLELPQVSAAEPFRSCLDFVLAAKPGFRYADRLFERACFRPGENAEQYLRAALSKKKRKEYRRLERRLAELGNVSWDELTDSGAAVPWIEQFLQLEASGWKGRAGTALAASAEDRGFFSAITKAAHARKRLSMLALRIDGRAIAMKCNLMAADGGFAFKIAYDEQYQKYSPGVLLELEQIRRLHDRPGLRWMDSCAAPGHFMANRLWMERKPMRSVLISAGSAMGNLVISILGLFRRTERWRQYLTST